MTFDLDKPVRVTSFGRITQKCGYWHKGRSINENLVLYCTDGNIDMQIGGSIYKAVKGDILLVCAGTFYRPMDSDGCTYYFMHFKAEKGDDEKVIPERITTLRHPDIAETDIAYSCHLERSSLVRLGEHIRNAGSVAEIFERASHLNPSVRFSDILMLDNLLRELLVSVRCGSMSGEYPKKLSRILSYIDANYGEHLTLGILSEKFGLSESYIARMFREKLKQKPSEYINGIRISAARSMLINTDLTVTQIAEKVGYSDVYYFSRIFTKMTGVSPGRCRNSKA